MYSTVFTIEYSIVKTNSKYKEDDCTDSNADVNSLDVCVHRILFRHTTHPTCQISAHPSSRFTSQSAENIRDDHSSVSGSNPGSFIVMMQIPIYQQTMLTSSSTLFQEFQNYQANIEMHSLIFETDKTAISHPVPRVLIFLYKRILTLFQGF